MTAVSQKIPNLIGGISQQPIEKQLPGTVKDAVNVVPDVKGLLTKRPGSQLVGTLSANDEGIWHNYYRDAAEQYFIRVRPDGQVDVWSALDALPRLVLYSDTPAKLYDPDFNRGVKQGDAVPITDTCNITDYQTTLSALTASVNALNTANAEIQEITVKLERDELTDAERAALEAEKTALEATIPGLLTNYTDAQAAFEVQAAPCGVFPNPYSVTSELTAPFGNALPYFEHTEDAQLQMVTINDITFVTNRKTVAQMTDKTSQAINKQQSFLAIDSTQYQRVYSFKVFDDEGGLEYEIKAGPYSTSTSLNAQLILENLKEDLDDKVPNVTSEIIGSGLYITRDVDFTIDTPDPQLMTPINDEINNVSNLPTQFKGDYVIKVQNTFEDEDDYYVKFVADGSSDSGAGVWEETVGFDLKVELDPFTMPHAIRRLSDGTFEVSPVAWVEREVGDNITNPLPSIVGQPINKTVFFRNRFVFLAGENCVFSRANEYWNLFGLTAKTIVDSDPIDILVASTYPSVLYDAIDTAPGLLLFATNQQFLVVAGSTEIFSPSTVLAKSIGTYKYNTKVRPVHMGQSVGFLNDGGFRSRFFELLPNRDANYSANETSKPVDNLIPSGINIIADSKDDNMLALAVKKGTTDDEELTRFVWIYRYFNTANERVQSAWFKWKVQGQLLYHTIMDDKYYAVTSVATGNTTVPNIVTLQSFDLKLDRQTILIGLAPTMEQYDYQVHMDNFKMVTPTQMTYDANANTTTWRLPIGYHGDTPIIAYEMELNYPSLDGYITTGRTAQLTSVGAPNGVFVTAPGNWTKNPALCGYDFNMRVEMPTFFVTKSTGENSFVADTTGYLTVHRAIIDFDVTGEVETTLIKKGQTTQVIGYESTIQDGYLADSTAVMKATQRTIPIYDKNLNVQIVVNSEHPTPTNITAVTWQGDYSQGNYRRV